jgi:hypothetical protein
VRAIGARHRADLNSASKTAEHCHGQCSRLKPNSVLKACLTTAPYHGASE